MKTVTQIAKDLGVTRSRIWQIIHELRIDPEFVGEKDGTKGTLALISDADFEKIKTKVGRKEK